MGIKLMTYRKSMLSGNKKSICHVEITSINLMPRVWRSAEAARDAGYKVSVIGYGENTNYNGIDFVGITPSGNRFDRVFRKSKEMVRRAAISDAYIVELHSPELLLYYKLLKREGKRIIFNSHEFYGMQILRREYLPKSIRWLISWIYIHWEKSISKKIDGIIYPCTVMGKNPFEFYKCESVKIENFSSKMAMLQSIREPRTAIYAGSLTEDRGCSIMVDLFNSIDGRLFLAGQFSSDSYKKYILQKANKNKVVYLGELSRKELFNYYSRMSVGLSLLKKEGQYNKIDNLSTKMYEYMSCGIPIVASDMDYAKIVNEKYEYGILVNPDDFEQIHNAIETLFSDKELSDRMGNNGRKAIEEEYNWDMEKPKLLAIYGKIMERD